MPGPRKLFRLVVEEVDVVPVTYRDRLTRFGFSDLRRRFAWRGVETEVVESGQPKGAKEELLGALFWCARDSRFTSLMSVS